MSGPQQGPVGRSRVRVYSCTMPLSRRVKGRGRTAAAVREKKVEEAERVQSHENGEGITFKMRIISHL